MRLFNQPFRAYIRATAVVVMCSITPHVAAAATPQPSIREAARKEVTRMVAADSRSAGAPYPPNYPQKFRPPMPNTRAGRRAVLVTLGAVGGLIAGGVLAGTISCSVNAVEDCGLASLAGAPIGAAAAGVTVAILTR
jgi:hypothetical protein